MFICLNALMLAPTFSLLLTISKELRIHYNHINIFIQMMQNIEKSLAISLLKVYNWGGTAANQTVQIVISDVSSSTVVLRKSANAQNVSNQLLINLSLKVTYTSSENQILLSIDRAVAHNRYQSIAEFRLNLDDLRDKKVQYLPFDGNSKVLKIVGEQAVVKTNFPDSSQFIEEKQSFLKKIRPNLHSMNQPQKLSLVRDSFTEKLFNLLQQTKFLRQKKRDVKSSRRREFCNQYYQDRIIEREATSQKSQRHLIKSNSQNIFTFKQLGRHKNRQGQSQVDKRSILSLVQKLNLKSLAIDRHGRDSNGNFVYQNTLSNRLDSR